MAGEAHLMTARQQQCNTSESTLVPHVPIGYVGSREHHTATPQPQRQSTHVARAPVGPMPRRSLGSTARHAELGPAQAGHAAQERQRANDMVSAVDRRRRSNFGRPLLIHWKLHAVV